MKSSLRRKMSRGVSYGAWVTIGNPDVSDILQGLPFDWLVFDTEHSPLGAETVSHMIQVLDEEKVSPLVRVGANDQYLIKVALDMGAHGVVVPLVNTRKDAEAAVSYCKYPPVGVRGVAPRKAADYGLSTAEYLRKANEETLLLVQVETKEALENIDAILAVKGVDIAFVGPTDLTMSLGFLDDRSNPRILEEMRSVVKKCQEYGKIPGTMALTPDEAKRDESMGFRFISLASDVRHLMEGAKDFLRSVGRF
ncbi:MAG: 2,4-dihydroxyhept-2-ene-1,7-dioic acid aldolase [Thaumarchaeota archaeon]|nr:MAG: 2,4-dihydroxyhept-2-ene-1,7-dioic acid aldolase [Nitrososphaerota archaeon]